LHPALYRYETWYLTLREDHRLRMLKNKVLKEILGPKREEVKRGWRKLHNEEPHDLYSSPNIKSGRMRSVGQMLV
jgi:hypothetical protein